MMAKQNFCNVERCYASKYFCPSKHFNQDSLMNKNEHLFQIVCNIIHVLTLIFHQLNASLMIKSINCFQKNIPTPNF